MSLAYATQAWVQAQGYLTAAYYHNPCTLGWDYELADFLRDGLWHDKDVSAIVPAGTVAVHLHFRLRANAVNKYVLINKPGEGEYGCNSYMYTQVANQRIGKTTIVTLDEDRKFSYRISSTGFFEINLKIMGWWL